MFILEKNRVLCIMCVYWISVYGYNVLVFCLFILMKKNMWDVLVTLVASSLRQINAVDITLWYNG